MSAPSHSNSSGFRDQFALWAGLGASLYVMPFGALLAPALSVWQAILAAATAAAIAGLLIATVVALASRTGHSSAELLAQPFGARARWPVAILLLIRHLIFVGFTLIVMVDAAELISERSLGVGLRPVWVLVFGLGAGALAMLDPRRVLSLMRRAWVWLALLLAIGVAASAYAEFAIPSYLQRSPAGGWPSFWQAVDIMLIFPLLWLPVAADFASLGGDPRNSARGAFAGVLLTCTWFGALGILYLPATTTGDIPGFVTGMGLGLGALVIIALLQLDETYVSMRGAISALDFAGIRAPSALSPLLALVVGVPLALFLHIRDLEGYTLLTASVFIPLFGVVIANALWPAEERDVFAPILAWVSGFALYQWITPSDIGWWRDGLDAVFGFAGLTFPLGDSAEWLGAALPAFLLAFAIQAVASFAGRFAPQARPEPQPES